MPPAPPPDFERCFAFTLGREGGFVDHPTDPGGATNHGVSLRYARSLGRVVDLDQDGDVDEDDIRLVTPEIARGLYRVEFWNAVRGDGLPGPLGLVAFDSAVLCAPHRAARWLQAAVGAKADGIIGPLTLAAAGRADLGQAIADLLVQRDEYLRGLPTFPTFGRGWLRRVKYCAMAAGAWAAEGRAA